MTREWPPFIFGGAGIHVMGLAARLTLDKGVSLEVLAMAPGLKGEQDHILTQALDFSAQAVAKSVGGGFHADVVHSHTWPANLAAHCLALESGRPHILTAHSIERSKSWKALASPAEFACSTWIEDSIYPGAAGLIAVSESMRRELEQLYAPRGPIAVIPNGVDPEQWMPDNSGEYLDRLGIDRSRPMIAYLGRFAPMKGIDLLLSAYGQLPDDVQLVLLAGRSKAREWDKSMATVEVLRRRGRAVTVVRENYDPATLRQVLSHAQLVVMPSRYEPFGMVSLEAMACGTPVVVAPTGGLVDIVDSAVGWVVPSAPGLEGSPEAAEFVVALAETVTGALEDPQECAERGQRGRARVLDDYTWERVAQQTVEFYRYVASI